MFVSVEKIDGHMKRTVLSLVTACLLLPGFAASPKIRISDPEKKKVDELLSQMTVREKVAQIFVVQIDRNNNAEERMEQDSLVRLGLGGIIIMRGPVAPFMDRANELQAMSKLPLMMCTDAEWGAAMRFYEYMDYPRQSQLSKIPHAEKLLYKMGRNVAKELKDLNIYVNFAPVADIAESGRDTYVARRFSHGPKHVADYASAYMRGMQDGGIYACGKHFPGHGDVYVDSHVELPVFYYTREHVDSTYLVPFQRLVDDGVAFMMMGHHAILAIDPQVIPMSISEKCVTELLKGEMGFDGIVVTDALQMGGVANGRTPVEVVMSAYKAGVDMLLMPDEPIACIEALTQAFENGSLPVAGLDERVRKILTLKVKAGFFKKGYDPVVRDLQKKISRARHRDSLLIDKMKRAMSAGDSLEIVPTYDPTLFLDRGRD